MMKRLISAAVCSCLAITSLCLPTEAAWAAQEATEGTSDESLRLLSEEPEDAKLFAFDYGVPSSPGLTLLGIGKDKVTQSNSLKPFVLSLPGLLSSDGDAKAVALDVSIGGTLVPLSRQTFESYAANYGRALLFRTRVNLALYRGVDDEDVTKEKPSLAAFGISSSLLNSSDPLLAPTPGSSGSAWIGCLKSAFETIRPGLPPPTGDPDADAAAIAAFKKSEASKMVPVCMKVADLAARLGPDLDAGFGIVKEGNPGRLSGFDESSEVLWGSFRTSVGVRGPERADFSAMKDWYDNFGRWFMLGFSARSGFNESITTGDEATPNIRANTFSGWAGLESYSKTNRLSLQLGRERIDPKVAGEDTFGGTRTRYLVTFDQSLGEMGLWVGLSYGKAEGEGGLKSDSTALVTLTFAAPDARKIFGGP